MVGLSSKFKCVLNGQFSFRTHLLFNLSRRGALRWDVKQSYSITRTGAVERWSWQHFNKRWVFDVFVFIRSIDHHRSTVRFTRSKSFSFWPMKESLWNWWTRSCAILRPWLESDLIGNCWQIVMNCPVSKIRSSGLRISATLRCSAVLPELIREMCSFSSLILIDHWKFLNTWNMLELFADGQHLAIANCKSY